MNLDELKAAVEASRRFSHTVEITIDDPAYVSPPVSEDDFVKNVKPPPIPQIVIGSRTFQLRSPTAHEVKMSYARARKGTDDHLAAYIHSQRELSERAVTGWTEINESDLLPDGAATPLPFDASLVPMLFDAHGDWQTSIAEAIDKRLVEKDKTQEVAAKN